MARRLPPLPGQERAPDGREFRWNRGLTVRPEPGTARGVLRFEPKKWKKERHIVKNSEKTMEKIVALCKGRGFIFAGSEIYGGLANT